MQAYIPLTRQFSPVPKDQEEAEKKEVLSAWGYLKQETWDELDSEFRCVILAEAGAGKTEEFRQRAKILEDAGKPAFFIRIEDIETDFYNAFEIGDETLFQTWLQSSGEAWFFLDSVDEARIANPRTFKKAIRRFAKGIARGVHRAHIYLSSRPYAWRPREDRRLLDEILFLPAIKQEEASEEKKPSKPQSALKIYIMRHLDRERIKLFCSAHSVTNIDLLLQEIERVNLWSLAERPFDLEGILAKWAEDEKLGSRIDLLRHNIDKRLRDDHCSDRAQRQPLNLERAKEGARRLSAAVMLTGQVGINVPDATPVRPGIEAESVLADWEPRDVRVLLERGIFNDILYGAVRFRHRDVRELLATEWFEGLLKSGNSRSWIESLFFHEQYGEKIIRPRLRPLLAWLILFDDKIRRKVLETHPEIAVEGGDPSILPFPERKEILAKIVGQIVLSKNGRSAQDHNAIARIANPDLVGETSQLLNKYGANDETIFFLGRLVEQGKMADCVEPFIDIALDTEREIYARRVSACAIMACGSNDQKEKLWQELNKNEARIPQELLEEILEETPPNKHSIKHLLVSLGKLRPYESFKNNSLESSLQDFIGRLPIPNNQGVATQLLSGFYSYLKKSPFIERSSCDVSEEYAWLLNPATHVLERLVQVQSRLALGTTALSIILMIPALHHWHDNDSNDYANNLRSLILKWPKLNDTIYWASIEQTRIEKVTESESLTDDWLIIGHFWSFNADSLPRLLEYIRSRTLEDDRLIALSTAFRIYSQGGRPAHMLDNLKNAVAGNSILSKKLDALLNPPISETVRRYNEKKAEDQRKQREEKEKNKQNHDAWIAELRANPDRIFNPPNQRPEDFTKDQCLLMGEVQKLSSTKNGFKYADWQVLVPEFGEAVACAYRDAAVKHWRHYLPKLRSEGADDNKLSYSLIFAMTGLEMEATENQDFPNNLDEKHVRHALRYIAWELNGFPMWLERMYQAFPDLVKEAIVKELHWEFINNNSDKPIPHILHKLVYYASWLHETIAPVIMEWMKTNPLSINTRLNYCLRILVNGDTNIAELTGLAVQQIAQTDDTGSISWWCALYVDCDPANGIPCVEKWLSDLDKDVATRSAQIFIMTFMGGRHGREDRPYFDHFRKAEYLKSLYVLMHRYIRVEEDIDRTSGGAYSPELRDDAQDARNRLFNLMAEIPGKASYTAIKQLIQEHPEPSYRSWMAEGAYKRAEKDGDLEPWSVEQVSAFDKSQTITPATHRQLFDLAVYRLIDLKNWLECGNDSPSQTWQRANEETEMRNLIAGWLNQQCREQYTTAQEPELANSQRMDIWMHSPKVQSPVPIELKLLDKRWSGPKLCERLQNQLAGDYLREESASCGVMLLVWQGNDSRKHWDINNSKIKLNDLANALKHYWQSIADEFLGVEEIEVIVIDLTKRSQVSGS